MTDATELLPCPFCGGDAEIFDAVEAGSQAKVVCCKKCMCSSRVVFALMDDVTFDLVSAWNARADLARPVTVAEAAKVRETDDEAAVMRRLIEGERIFYSQDGKVAWLSDADRAHVSYRVVWALRNQGYLKRVSSGEGRVFCDEASDSLRALSQGGE